MSIFDSLKNMAETQLEENRNCNNQWRHAVTFRPNPAHSSPSEDYLCASCFIMQIMSYTILLQIQNCTNSIWRWGLNFRTSGCQPFPISCKVKKSYATFKPVLFFMHLIACVRLNLLNISVCSFMHALHFALTAVIWWGRVDFRVMTVYRQAWRP